MEKQILILTGSNDGKTAFINLAKSKGLWVWNFSAENRLSKLSYDLGFDGNRSKKYYDWLIEFRDLANKYWNFEDLYFIAMIEKFILSEKANVAILHNATPDAVIKLKNKKLDNLITVNIFDEVPSDVEANQYDAFCNYNAPEFENQVLSLLKVDINKGE